MAEQEQEEVVDDRQNEEWDALVAFYGEDAVTKTTTTTSEDGGRLRRCCWKIQIQKDVYLCINDIPPNYPSSCCGEDQQPMPPTPKILAPQWILDEQRRKDLQQELIDLYEHDIEVAIIWAEHCREQIEDYISNNQNNNNNISKVYNEKENHEEEEDSTSKTTSSATATTTRKFVPPSGKHGQPMRTFDISIVDNDQNRREIYKGQPFHPPKSGPAETMVAHVASIKSMDQYYWVLHKLLLEDKKVGQASHNMIAYKFYDTTTNCYVSDSDDDGEKGAGSKLASLLDLTDVQDCMVVVSRWYGGIHLGPARFKWIAVVARQALEEAGFIKK